MSAALLGATIGLVIALASFALLRMLAARVDLAETKRVLNVTGMIELVLFPVAGWFIGAQFAGD